MKGEKYKVKGRRGNLSTFYFILIIVGNHSWRFFSKQKKSFLSPFILKGEVSVFTDEGFDWFFTGNNYTHYSEKLKTKN